MSDVQQNDTRHSVAWELTKMIKISEKMTDQGNQVGIPPNEAREYWFTLYEQSLKIVNGWKTNEVLSKNQQT